MSAAADIAKSGNERKERNKVGFAPVGTWRWLQSVNGPNSRGSSKTFFAFCAQLVFHILYFRCGF